MSLMALTINKIITLRRHDLDKLKTFLTGLVVVHHTAIAYGGAGHIMFQSRLIPRGHVSLSLLVFNGFNQSFFIGLFFCISGHMSAQALNKQGVFLAAFLKTRVVRLLVPTAVNTMLGQPRATCLAQGRVNGVFQAYWRQVRGARGVTWYTATLLASDAVGSDESLPMAVAISVLTSPICTLGLEGSTSWSGGWNHNAAIYAVWNELPFMLIGPALMVHF